MGTYDNYTVTVRDSTKYEGFTVTSMLITDGVVSVCVCVCLLVCEYLLVCPFLSFSLDFFVPVRVR